jgi:pantoate--beta-alanine ligase
MVFAPEVADMYPAGEETRVHVGALAEPLCGAHRPGHFEGVATVVTKLLAIVGPCVAVFGKKDYQQLAVLRRVVKDLFLPVNVIGHSIVREPDGLAMSSRNAYLLPEERAQALALSRGLRAASRAFEAGERRAALLQALVLTALSGAGISNVEYASVAHPESLVPFAADASVGDRALLAVACRVGTTRLIDNTVLGEDSFPP